MVVYQFSPISSHLLPKESAFDLRVSGLKW